MKIFSTILTLIIIAGCSKQPSAYRATLFNNSTHDIKILFYKDGVVDPNDIVLLRPNTQFLFAYNSTGRGSNTGKGRGFNSDYFGSSDDSIVVIFDRQYSITHYANTPTTLAKHYYLAESLRNIGNPYSYDYEIIEGKDIINDHKYYFTEQDYLDAKD